MVISTRLSSLSQLDPGVATLRSRLQELNVWPDAGDQFLMLMTQSRTQTSLPSPSDKEWVTAVAKDALKACDIGARYPAFFQKLLNCPTLLEAFLAELDRQQDTVTVYNH
jgi:hypothetical protein